MTTTDYRRPAAARSQDRNRRPRRAQTADARAPRIDPGDTLIQAAGIVDLGESYAFLRTDGYAPGPGDLYVSPALVRRHGLRRGDVVTGVSREPAEGERRPKADPLLRVDTVNGKPAEATGPRAEFAALPPLYPQQRLRLETDAEGVTTRLIDLIAPIGKGQRALIVSPPKAGKTMVLQAIAHAVAANNPECHLMVVLIDERPEEVTEMQRSVDGEVIASTFDRPPQEHTAVAELAIERAKRLVEEGRDVVVLFDSLTRLGRAYNNTTTGNGRTLSGGVDSNALHPPKRLFGAARNIDGDGSLTIIATALVETGSLLDTVIFEEFKGTGNMELKLDRKLANKRIFPAIDVDASGTRKEDILLSAQELAAATRLRRALQALDSQQAIETVLERMRTTDSNAEFLRTIHVTTARV